jgi:hypothetical protein
MLVADAHQSEPLSAELGPRSDCVVNTDVVHWRCREWERGALLPGLTRETGSYAARRTCLVRQDGGGQRVTGTVIIKRTTKAFNAELKCYASP